MSQSYDIAIIGGGFSGLMVLHHLVEKASGRMSVAVFEPRGSLGNGLAYSTRNYHHLLNVPAKGMSALPDEPSHFFDWLNSESGQAACRDMHLQQSWQKTDFAPRALFARYLGSIAAKCVARGFSRGVKIEHLRQTAQSLRKTETGYVLESNGKTYLANACVLASGNLASGLETGSARHVTDIWSFDFSRMAGQQGPVAIIGTGLTMVDIAIALRDAGYKGKITGVSRNGRLPQVHDMAIEKYGTIAAQLVSSPQTLLRLMHELRREVKEGKAMGRSWQVVMDNWRPHLQGLWRQLGTEDRKKFLHRFFSLWSVHRHRMAPSIGAFVRGELEAGTLQILSGNVQAQPAADHVDLTAGNETIRAAWVFDCRGPCYDIRKSGNALLRQMTDEGVIMPHKTGWGADIGEGLRIAGHERLFTIGPLATGALMETIAVPELREQAALVAKDILQI